MEINGLFACVFKMYCISIIDGNSSEQTAERRLAGERAIEGRTD